MTQTQTHPHGHPDPDPDPDRADVRTRTPVEARTRTASGPDPDRSPDGPGPDATRTQTPTRTQTYDADSTANPTINDLAGPGPDDDVRTRTQSERDARTRTQAEHDHMVAARRRMTKTIDYPGGWLARRRAASVARRRATDQAIARGTEAELLLLEAEAAQGLDAVSDDEDEPPARWEKFAAGWPQTVLTIAVAIMASVGQIQFAKEQGAVRMIWLLGHDITPFFAPAVLDLSVAALYARGMYAAVRYKASPWLPWSAGTAIGLFSVYTNTKHQHGSLLFAGASAVGVICWMVALLLKYWNLPHVKARRATAKPRLLTSSLALASWATATRAWTISRRRPIATCAAAMQKAGKKITERDLVVQVAELFNTVIADRTIAELEKVGDPPAKDAGREAMRAWTNRCAQARRKAEIVAWDAVDRMLGLDVVEREGIQVNQVTYLEPEPARVRTRTIATAAAPAAPALSATTQQVRRRAVAPPPAAAPAGQGKDVVVVVTGRPTGNKFMNWAPLDEIPGLPVINPELRCECGAEPSKRCGEALAEHVERRGEHIRAFIQANKEWARQPERVRKPDVVDLLKLGSGAAMEVVYLMNQLRALPGAAECSAQDTA